MRHSWQHAAIFCGMVSSESSIGRFRKKKGNFARKCASCEQRPAVLHLWGSEVSYIARCRKARVTLARRFRRPYREYASFHENLLL